MSTREQLEKLVRNHRFDELRALVKDDPGAARFLLALTYRPEHELRAAAARGMAIAAEYHPELVQEMARRLVWAMNEESGTFAVTAPEVLQAIAEDSPQILLPLVPSLLRLITDPRLRDPLIEVVRTVARCDPGAAVASIGRALTNCPEGARS